MADPFKFPCGREVRHIKSGKRYVIVFTPDRGRLESTGEPAYTYQGMDRILWHRSQAEMEDGRFELISEEESQ